MQEVQWAASGSSLGGRPFHGVADASIIVQPDDGRGLLLTAMHPQRPLAPLPLPLMRPTGSTSS
jgi:hypothetical protein